ncbi:NUDIX hydrolase [Candidatus Micrarchaeota archaeon]|nr:NUDIX hydrolase [Candidatus Micrarchaeota archaeon]MBU1930987.1 NUDIX hydrolase [Candidatus Micrarchaeota archaeon]
MNLKVVCGALVVKENKFVLVQEAQPHCYGQWNFPGGHLDQGEDVFTAAIREVKEETSLDIKLDGLISLYKYKNSKGENVIRITFKATIVGGTLKVAQGELLDAKWFSFEEFSKLKDSDLREKDMRTTVKNYKTKPLIDLNLIKSMDF